MSKLKDPVAVLIEREHAERLLSLAPPPGSHFDNELTEQQRAFRDALIEAVGPHPAERGCNVMGDK